MDSINGFTHTIKYGIEVDKNYEMGEYVKDFDMALGEVKFTQKFFDRIIEKSGIKKEDIKSFYVKFE